MAAITITRPLTQSGCNLLSVFNINTIDFRFDQTGTSGEYYLRVEYDSVQFEPFRESFSSPNGYYTFDFSDILKYSIGLPEFGYNAIKTYYVRAYYVIDNSLITSASETINLCYGLNQLGSDSILYELWDKGRSFDFFTCGNMVSFFWKLTTSTVGFKINGGASFNRSVNAGFSSVQFPLVDGYNAITCDTNADFYLGVYYQILKADETEINWLNSDGTSDNWGFKMLTKEYESSRENEISNYSKQQSTLKSKSTKLSISSKEKTTFKTIAYNSEHFRQLLFLNEAFYTEMAGLNYRVSDCTKSYSINKNKPLFNLTLEQDRYAATY